MPDLAQLDQLAVAVVWEQAPWGNAKLDQLSAGVVWEQAPWGDAKLDQMSVGVVWEQAPWGNAKLDQMATGVVWEEGSPVAVLPNIAGPPTVLATFDGSGSQFAHHYKWAWTSVPGGSAIANTIIPFPDNAASTPIDMTDNVGLWHFEGNADDTSGQGNNGTVSGATQVTGKVGTYAYEFNGSSDYIEVTGSDVFPGTTNAITISLWQYGDSSQPRADTIFEGFGASGNRVINSHFPWSDGRIYWDCGDGGTSTVDRIDKAASTAEYEGQWNHWVFTKDVASGAMKLYLNGAEWHSGTGKTRTLSTISTFRIGGALWPGVAPYAGKIDEFAVWTRALSATEIADIYRLQSGAAAGPDGQTFAFTPDIVGTYTIQLTVADGVSTTADADIAVAGGAIFSLQSGSLQGLVDEPGNSLQGSGISTLTPEEWDTDV